MLLTLASAVFLGPESLGTRDHILLSQIWDFPFRHLLRLAGSRWRYSFNEEQVFELQVMVLNISDTKWISIPLLLHLHIPITRSVTTVTRLVVEYHLCSPTSYNEKTASNQHFITPSHAASATPSPSNRNIDDRESSYSVSLTLSRDIKASIDFSFNWKILNVSFVQLCNINKTY
jgi:hypothetical protein